MSKFQTDALRPSALPSANLGRPKHLSRADGVAHRDELGKAYEEWNKRIDDEVKGLAGGLKALVDLANIGEAPLPHAHTTTALDLQLCTSQLVLQAQNLRDIAHDLKLTLLLSDQISLIARRDAEFWAVRREIDAARLELGREWVKMRGQGDEEGSEREGGDGQDRGEGGDDDGAHAEVDASRTSNLEPPLQPSQTVPRDADSDDEDMEEVG